MVFSDPATGVILAIIIGTLGAIVYALRILVLLERRIARIDAHIEMVVKKLIREELAIESEEHKIEAAIRRIVPPKKRSTRKKPAKKATREKTTRRKPVRRSTTRKRR